MIVSNRETPAAWKVLTALLIVYLVWGTTFLAIKEGVRTLPPALFGGSRVLAAGLVLMGFLGISGRTIRLPVRELCAAWLISVPLFVGGNGLMTWAQTHLTSSGEAAILAATSPLWLGLFETLWPGGDRLSFRGWLGLIAGLLGVAVLRFDSFNPVGLFTEFGALLALGSAMTWAIGSFAIRRRRQLGESLAVATWQMVFGGANLVLVGLLCGEASQVQISQLTPTVIGAFVYLLFVGSLLGFIAYSWLLNNVSTTLAGTHAYVNPMVALLVGWLIGGEIVRLPMLGGMAVILIGVALVRGGERRKARLEPEKSPVIRTSSPAPLAERLPTVAAPMTHGA